MDFLRGRQTHNLRLTEFCNRKLPGFGLVFG
jgi:hypothetical protein